MELTPDGHVSFAAPGIYHVRARSGEFYSGWVQIRANEKVPARLLQAPSPNYSEYDGKEHALVKNDARFEGGIRMLYGLSEDDTTEPKEYSSFIPTATEVGEYHVWCLIQPDEDHDASDAVRVTSAITKDEKGRPGRTGRT